MCLVELEFAVTVDLLYEVVFRVEAHKLADGNCSVLGWPQVERLVLQTSMIKRNVSAAWEDSYFGLPLSLVLVPVPVLAQLCAHPHAQPRDLVPGKD